MSDYIGIGWNQAKGKWYVVAYVKECETMEAAKQSAEEMKDKIAAAFKELRNGE